MLIIKRKRLADYSRSASLFLISLFYNLTAIPIITLGNEKSINFLKKLNIFLQSQFMSIF
ncbi:hypothetical protein ELI_2414 [Eubacterium callanderi]|uniref:Uncharacterized protein n=1 Tax=Eubacterium callanderi TaxID=53442 RepID=E3GN19_9FIRM|nr:hypothetical protein ELI_2414 [Eubacterium callanderi]